jgi:uncharacterized protein YecE (DUF72 family)
MEAAARGAMSRRKASDERQGHLFGRPASEPTPSRVGPAPVPDSLAQAAARLPPRLHLGTSSWSFPGWSGLVYDREVAATRLARHGLAAYARHPLLRAVGIDRTFYAPLPAAAFAAYAAVVPEPFRFLVKAHSAVTTPVDREGPNPSYLDAARAIDAVVMPFVEGLGERGGPLLFQFPPQGEIAREPQRFAERLVRFLGALPRGPLYAVELRDAALLVPDYFAALASAGVRHGFAVHPRLPSLAEQRRRATSLPDGDLVARWMLHAGLGYEAARRRYAPFARLVDEAPDERSALADLALEHAARGHRAFVIANNKAEGSAPLSIFKLAETIGDRHRNPGFGDRYG